MKKILRRIASIPVVNFFTRSLLKSIYLKSEKFFKTLVRYNHVSGKVDIVIGGQPISLWAKSDDALASKVYYDSRWEIGVVFWFGEISKRSMFIIDAGANIGLYSLLAAVNNRQAIVQAFEPNPFNNARLRRNVALNGVEDRVEVHQVALGDTNGEISFFLPDDDRISDVSSVYPGHTSHFNDFKHRKIQVQCVTLDAFCKAHSFYPQLIKIDVELYELQVMQGMKRLLTSVKPFIFCEIFNDVIKRKLNPALNTELVAGYTNILRDFLASVDYHFYLVLPEGILRVEAFTFSITSSMYLLLPFRLKQEFYLPREVEIVLNELSDAR